MKIDSNGHEGVLRKFPSSHKKLMTVDDWLLGKREDDATDGLWRIHDTIYDFTDFARKHPGGRFWLDTTKGTDITEAFESHHLTDKAEKLLQKYKVKKAKTPRISLITFHENGFYKSLKKRIRQSNLKLSGSTWKTRWLADSFLFCFVLTSLLGVWQRNLWWSVLAGAFLEMLAVSSHNFFHMKDNFRMYYFNFSLLSFREWRISHALSHHQYTNTILDLEVTMFDPIFRYLPCVDKGFFERLVTCIMSPIIFAFLLHAQFVVRLKNALFGKRMPLWDDFLGFSIPLLLWLMSDNGFSEVLISWNVTILAGSFLFALIGLTAAHHHPDIYHEGDYLGKDKDFGVLQLAAVRDREEIDGNIFLTLISFGDHSLHHMFPTVDHGNLEVLRPHFDKICEEFNIVFPKKNSGSLVVGMYKQLCRNYVNGKLLIKGI